MDVLINNNTHRAISVQSSKILGNTDESGFMHHNKAISEQSSKFLCNTDDLLSYASSQTKFRTKF